MRGRRPLPTVATIVSGRVGLAVARRLASSLVQVDRSVSSPVAVLKLARPPANSLSLEFMAEVRSSLAELEADPEVRGVVLSSSNPKIVSPVASKPTRLCSRDVCPLLDESVYPTGDQFSAGLDLKRSSSTQILCAFTPSGPRCRPCVSRCS